MCDWNREHYLRGGKMAKNTANHPQRNGLHVYKEQGSRNFTNKMTWTTHI